MNVKTKYEREYIKFGLKVQYYRKLRGMTQEAFADKVGISWSYLAKIESPARAFGVSMETLFSIARSWMSRFPSCLMNKKPACGCLLCGSSAASGFSVIQNAADLNYGGIFCGRLQPVPRTAAFRRKDATPRSAAAVGPVPPGEGAARETPLSPR